MEPTQLFESLDEAQARLLRTVSDRLNDQGELDAEKVVPIITALAELMCQEGDAAMCAVWRSWIWEGAVAMLEEAGFDVNDGWPDYSRKHAFILGAGAKPARSDPENPAAIIPFPPRS